MSPAPLGYGLASVVFTVLAAVSLTRWRRGLSGLWLGPALTTSAVWSALEAAAAGDDSWGRGVLIAVDTFRLSLWLVVLTILMPKATDQWLQHLRRTALIAPPVVVAVATAFAVLRNLGFLADAGPLPLIAGGLVLSSLGLVLVEQTIRNAASSARWALKYVALGIGTMLAFDLLFFASEYLLSGVAGAMADARGGANALAGLSLAVGLRRLSGRRPAQPGSQDAMFYTSSLIAIGAYLLGMAFTALYIRAVGGTWGAALQALFLTCALLLLAALIFSEQVRAWLRVTLARSFAPYRYDYRAEWLRLTATLSAGEQGGALPERALLAVTRIVHSASGGLWARDDVDRYVPVAGELATAPDHTIDSHAPWIRYLETREWVLDLTRPLPSDMQAAPLPDWLRTNARAWLVVPLLAGDGLEGIVVIAQPLAPSLALTWEDLDLLKTTGRQVAAFLGMERVAQRLAQSQQFEAYNRLATFMMHDLKNVAAQLSMVVRNAEKHRRNPEFVDDAIATIDNAARRMGRVLEHLDSGSGPGTVRRIDVARACLEVKARCSDRVPLPALVTPTEALEVAIDGERLTHVLEHIVRNAQDATPPSGSVRLTVADEGSMVAVEIEDSGCGMDAKFVRDRLFRPFSSTKGSHGMGVGAFQAREFVKGAGGDVQVKSAVGAGTSFRIRLPRAARD
jgi:putative PEP-CTERM system histidine kinase